MGKSVKYQKIGHASMRIDNAVLRPYMLAIFDVEEVAYAVASRNEPL
jgi:hypothetical protein